ASSVRPARRPDRTFTSRYGCAAPPSTRSRRSASRLFLRRELLFPAQTAIEPIDEIGHALEPVGDHADPELEEVLGLDGEPLGQLGDDVVRGDRTAPVDDVVEVAGGETRLRGQATVGRAGVLHEPFDRGAE